MCSSHETVLSTGRHLAHPVSVLILPPREIQALWSENHDTEILHCNAVSRVDNAMSCHRTGYDRYDIQMLAILDASKGRKTKGTKKQKKQINPE